ncbi:MAG: AMP-binding protein [Acidobacteriota bacterium]
MRTTSVYWSMDPRVAGDFRDMGFTILQGYGLTETTGACTVTPVEKNILGSVGPALPGIEIKIHKPDETGTGEILIRGPIVMKEYYRNSQATADVIRDGWLHSGDLGKLDKDGNLFVTGRKKEIIVLPNGKNIYPDELEMHYLQSPSIQEIAVVGILDPKGRGEKLHAVIVPDFEYLKSHKIANAKEILRDHVAGLSNRLPQYKRLMSYQIRSEALPRTTTRKIKRLELKGQIENEQSRSAPKRSVPLSADTKDRALFESDVGKEVVRCMRATHNRDIPVDADMNLELDLGYDSMERVELLASLEQSLNLELPDDFGAEILTVRDLVEQLRNQTGSDLTFESAKQSWNTILSEDALDRDEHLRVAMSGSALALFKFVCLRVIHYVVFRTLLRIRIYGLDNLPEKGPFLICPNHQSFIDPFVLISSFPYKIFKQLFFVGYSVFFSKGFMKLAAKLTNVVPVDPDAHLLRAMKTGARGLRDGLILCIFPEGGRSYDGELQPFKKGAAILSKELDVPVIPAAICGAYKVWPRDSYRIRPHRVTVRFGEPITSSASGSQDSYQTDTDKLREAVATLLKE